MGSAKITSLEASLDSFARTLNLHIDGKERRHSKICGQLGMSFVSRRINHREEVRERSRGKQGASFPDNGLSLVQTHTSTHTPTHTHTVGGPDEQTKVKDVSFFESRKNLARFSRLRFIRPSTAITAYACHACHTCYMPQVARCICN